ncbi:N-acetyltransferase [Bifidobacterium gallicum]|nr:N-acetyltransferase [Bifidobacterium gallicum]EFA22567.1 hypothetical protein BIFGAL_03593 [Bifidobacterium gallicum DSM 20093 = LMG 11596]
MSCEPVTPAASLRRFRLATIHDIDAMQRIYARARELMSARGNPTQWGMSYPTRDVIEQDIRHHQVMLFVDDVIDNAGSSASNGADSDGTMPHAVPQERILAQFALCPGPDPDYAHIEGAWLDDDPYVAIHRVASAGLVRHAARDAIAWVVEHHGNVRVDTHPNNHAMQHTLETMGFARCGLIQVSDREYDATRIAYQRHEW